MNLALWIGQILLATVFLASGTAKSTMSKERMVATGQTGVALFPVPVVRFVASAEIAASIGLVLPRLTGIAPWLTTISAGGLCLVMAGAASAHIRLHEPRNVVVTTVLFAMCAFVAIGRLSS